MRTDQIADAHDHVVGFYRDDDELVGSISEFLAVALAGDGGAVIIATEPHRHALAAALAARGLAVESLAANGRYRSLDAAETLAAFMRGDTPDPGAFATTMGTLLDEVAASNPAASESGAPVHAFGEMVALLWDQGNIAAAIELESLWNDLAADHRFALYCAYATSTLEASGDLGAAKRVCDRHSRVMTMHGADGSPALGHAPDANEVTRLFFPTTGVVHDVRRFVREVLHGWEEAQVLDECVIVTSELATNAVLHARSPFRVLISRSASAIRIAVRDASAEPPRRLEDDVDRRGGRGIAVVAALAHSWNTELEADGKTIWATMTREPTLH